MATILFNAEDIGDAYAPSLNAAFRELYLASGRAPLVKSPLGGKRTLAQAISLGSGSSSDHYKGRAVDIDNHRVFRNWNQTRFLNILAAHGWRNVQIGGAPFPSEPWHFANQSSHPQGSGGSPIPGSGSPGTVIDYALLRRQKEDGMYIKGTADTIYYVWPVPGAGKTEWRMEIVPPNIAAFARAGGVPVLGNDQTLVGAAVEAGWPPGGPAPVYPLPRVDADVNVGDVTVQLPDGLATKADVDAVPAAVVEELKKPGN